MTETPAQGDSRFYREHPLPIPDSFVTYDANLRCGHCGAPLVDESLDALLAHAPSCVTGSRAGREGDSQPMPTPNAEPDVQSQVIADIETRRQLGVLRYGTPLQANNGRDAMQDLYEELLDACMYIKQVLVERGPL